MKVSTGGCSVVRAIRSVLSSNQCHFITESQGKGDGDKALGLAVWSFLLIFESGCPNS